MFWYTGLLAVPFPFLEREEIKILSEDIQSHWRGTPEHHSFVIHGLSVSHHLQRTAHPYWVVSPKDEKFFIYNTFNLPTTSLEVFLLLLFSFRFEVKARKGLHGFWRWSSESFEYLWQSLLAAVDNIQSFKTLLWCWGATLGIQSRECVSAETQTTLFVDISFSRVTFSAKKKAWFLRGLYSKICGTRVANFFYFSMTRSYILQMTTRIIFHLHWK